MVAPKNNPPIADTFDNLIHHALHLHRIETEYDMEVNTLKGSVQDSMHSPQFAYLLDWF